MLAEDELFSGVRCAPEVAHAVYADIACLVQRYPALRAGSHAFPGASDRSIVICGAPPLRIDGENCALPIAVVLPPAFPYAPPICSISAPDGFRLRESRALGAGGAIDLPRVFRWVPRASRLVQAVYAILNFFGNNPPFSAKRAKALSSAPDELQRQIDAQALRVRAERVAEELIAENAVCVHERYERRVHMQLLRNMTEALNEERERLESDTRKLEEELGRAEAVPLPEVVISPIVMQCAAERAREQAHRDTLQEIRKEFHSGRITVEQCLKITREQSRAHFERHILQIMQ